MKNEKVIEYATKAARALDGDRFSGILRLLRRGDKFAHGDFLDPEYYVAKLIYEAEQDEKAQTVKAAGTADKVKAAQNILAQWEKRPSKPTGAYHDELLGWVICGYAAAVALEELPQGVDENKLLPVDIRKVFDNVKQNEGEHLPLPPRAEVKHLITIEKAKHKGEKKFVPLYDFGENRPQYDARILLDVLTLLGDGGTITISRNNPTRWGAYIQTDAGTGVIYPVAKRGSTQL